MEFLNFYKNTLFFNPIVKKTKKNTQKSQGITPALLSINQ